MVTIAGGIVLGVVALCVLVFSIAALSGFAMSIWDAITDPGNLGYRGRKKPTLIAPPAS
jgi:hypothetical protein